jgi:carbohydrate-selective porin OprB
MGIGINVEQQLADDVGVFFRGMYADGKTEVYSFTSTDRSISVGGLLKGTRWDRQKDLVGIGYAENWISSQHAAYLKAGGVDGFIGDGYITQTPEKAVELFYRVNLIGAVYLTADYQHLMNPAFNSDRGAVNVYGLKTHIEF